MDINIILSEQELLLLQEVFYLTITDEARQQVGKIDESKEPTMFFQQEDGTLRPVPYRFDMNDVIPNPKFKALWIKIEDQWEQQHPFSVL